MDEKLLIQNMTTIYQMLDQVKCNGHQNHKYLTVSMDGILDLIQRLQEVCSHKDAAKDE